MAKDMPDFSHLPVTIRRWKIGKRQTIEIDRDFVRVTEKGLAAANWAVSTSAFKGVLRRTDAETPGGWAREVTVHLVELAHPDPTKTLRLYKHDEEKGTRKLWVDAARALGLPALDETSDGIVARPPEDLDKSIRDLAAEGKISVNFDADTPAPKGIVWQRADSELRVTLSLGANPYGTDVLKFVGGATAISLAALGGFEGGYLTFIGIGGAYFAITGAWPLLLDGIATRRIVITPSHLSYFRETPFGNFSYKGIPFNKLEAVYRISEATGSWSLGPIVVSTSHEEILAMESDTEKISIDGLGKEQLYWLERFILAAIIHPPR